VRRRHQLGSWCCPSGNGVDVFISDDDGHGLRHLFCEWDKLPLSPADADHWTTMILPAVTREAQLYLEKIGAALVLQL
jgi:hypothetical protein